MRQLTRERDQITQDITSAKNQRHAEESGAFPNETSLKRIAFRIKTMQSQRTEIEQEIKETIAQDEEVLNATDLICTIPGVGLLTAATVLAETDGFCLFRNKQQVISYAGLDVVERQSGTSIHGKPRISKRGNRFLRKAMHMPAFSSAKYNEAHKALYVRIVSKNGIKMKANVAVQRKLLELIFAVHKNKKPFDPTYKNLLMKMNRLSYLADIKPP